MNSKRPDDFEEGHREFQAAEESPTEEALGNLEPYLLPDKKPEVRRVLTRFISKTHSGPIPSADELEHLEAVLPGCANRILEMTERDQRHRHVIEESIVEKEFGLRSRGQTFALVALGMMLIAVAWLGYLGFSTAATGLGVGIIVAVVTVFATGKHFEAKENEALADELGESASPTPENGTKRLPPPQRKKKRGSRRR